MPWLPRGTAILARYVLMGPIGHGGMAVVYQAVDSHQGRAVALKMLAPALAADPRARDKIRFEAMVTHQLRHPSVPRVYDVGEAPLPDGSTVPYLAMELLSGTIADVLAVAHRRGIVHRDLTPDNVMLTRAGVKIIDFGVAGSVGHADSEPADDVYALGVLLYQMLTGSSPYPSMSATALLSASRFRCLAPTPVLLVPGLPREVADICRRFMAKRRADRPSSSAAALALWGVLAQAPTYA